MMNIDTARRIVRTVRKRNKVSAKDLAKEIGITHGMIHRFENGSSDSSVRVVFKLFELLDLRIFIVDDFDGKVVYDNKREIKSCTKA